MTRWRCIRIQESDVPKPLWDEFKPRFTVEMLGDDGRRLEWVIATGDRSLPSDYPGPTAVLEDMTRNGLKPPEDLFSRAISLKQALLMESNLKNSSFRGEEWWPECV